MPIPLPRQNPIISLHKPNTKSDFKGKVFVLGYNKTGTSSLGHALETLGFKGQTLIKEDPRRMKLVTSGFNYLHPWYSDGNFPFFVASDDISWLFHNNTLFNFVKETSQIANLYGDSPWMFLYPILYEWFPGSRFILTIRNTTHEVVNSSVKMAFRRKKDFDVKSIEVLKNSKFYGQPLQDYMMLTARLYEQHNDNVISFFSQNPEKKNDLLILNLNKQNENIWMKLCNFLECPVPDIPFPIKNKAPTNQSKYLVPENENLDWSNYSFNERFSNFFKLTNRLKQKGKLDDYDWALLKNEYQAINNHP